MCINTSSLPELIETSLEMKRWWVEEERSLTHDIIRSSFKCFYVCEEEERTGVGICFGCFDGRIILVFLVVYEIEIVLLMVYCLRGVGVGMWG